MPKEDARSRADWNAAYRRGTVLGLTIAEVFILLLFLLMLVFLALAQEWQAESDLPLTEPQKALKETKSKLETAQAVLKNLRKVIEEYRNSIPLPDEPVTLEKPRPGEDPDAKDSSDASTDTLLREVLQRAKDAVQKAQRRTERAEAQAQRADADRNRAQQEANRAARELDVFREKGHNPPCWYVNVSDGRHGKREKPYYTFEVAVFDETMILRPVPAPLGGADDDEESQHSSYADEAKFLQLDQLPYNTPLSDPAMVEAIRPIYDAGKEGWVRSYSCIFWARVWDETSPNAKERWKSAHDGILESFLGTYTVSDDPWETSGVTGPTRSSLVAVLRQESLRWLDRPRWRLPEHP